MDVAQIYEPAGTDEPHPRWKSKSRDGRELHAIESEQDDNGGRSLNNVMAPANGTKCLKSSA